MKNIVFKESDTFDGDAVREFFSKLDVREATKKEYRYFAQTFLSFVRQNGLNPNTFREYKAALASKTSIAVSTKNKHLTAARVLLKEMSRVGMIPIDITHNTKSFVQNKKHKKDGLTDKEVLTLVAKIQSAPQNPQNARLKAIVCLLALQGLRQCEVVRLDVSDLDLANKIAYIRGKGMDDKEPIHLHPETSRALAEYLRVSRIADGAVFTRWSNNGRNTRLSTGALREIVKDNLRALDISKSVHGFRHYFTTKLIRTYKGDLLEVARYTRHKSLEMLQVYNDNIKQRADLPRYYGAFSDVHFDLNSTPISA